MILFSNMEEWILRSRHFRSHQICLHSCTFLAVRSSFLTYDMCTLRWYDYCQACMCLSMHVCFNRYEFDRLFYHFARKEQEKKTFGSLGIRHFDNNCGTKCNLHQLDPTRRRCTISRKFSWSFAASIYDLRESSHCEPRKVVVLGSGWGALSFVRKLDPSAFDATWKSDQFHQFASGNMWTRVITCRYTCLHVYIQ